MSIRFLAVLLACVCMTACAIPTKKLTPPETYGAGDPGVIHKGELWWVGNPTDEQKAEWIAYHLAPVIEEQEWRDLKWWAYGSAADNATTYIGLTKCIATRELNPLFAGLSPAGIVLVNGAGSVVFYYYMKGLAAKTSRYQGVATSSVPGKIRAVPAVLNAFTLATCA